MAWWRGVAWRKVVRKVKNGGLCVQSLRRLISAQLSGRKQEQAEGGGVNKGGWGRGERDGWAKSGGAVAEAGAAAAANKYIIIN